MIHDPTPIRARLRTARQNAGLSQETVSERLNLTKHSMSRAECGHRQIYADEMVALAALYGVSVTWLLTGEDEVAAKDRTIARLEDENARLRHELLCLEVGVISSDSSKTDSRG